MSVQGNFINARVTLPEQTEQKRFWLGNTSIDKSFIYVNKENLDRVDTDYTTCSNQTFLCGVKESFTPIRSYGSNVFAGSVKHDLKFFFKKGLFMVSNVSYRVLISHRSINKTFM